MKKYKIASSVVVLIFLTSTGVLACSSPTDSRQAFDLESYDEASYNEAEALGDQLFEYFQINSGGQLSEAHRTELITCLLKNPSPNSVGSLVGNLQPADVGAPTSTPAAILRAPSAGDSDTSSESGNLTGLAAQSSEPSAQESAQENARAQLEQETTESVLRAISDCQILEVLDLGDYQRFTGIVNNPECAKSELWEKVNAARFSGKKFTNEEANRLGERMIYCNEYFEQGRRTIEVYGPWFDWDCLVETSLITEFENQNAREFAKSIYGDASGYVPLAGWELSQDETIDLFTSCISIAEVIKVLKLEDTTIESQDLSDCIKEHFNAPKDRRKRNLHYELVEDTQLLSVLIPDCLYESHRS